MRRVSIPYDPRQVHQRHLVVRSEEQDVEEDGREDDHEHGRREEHHEHRHGLQTMCEAGVALNFAAKALIGAKKRSSARAALEKLNMMPLTEKRKVHLGVFIHNIINGNGPKDVVSRYKKLLDREHTHQTRAAARRDFIASAHRTSKYDDSVQQRAVKCWNGIPFTIRQIDNATSFKRTYQKYLLNKYKEDNVYTQCASPVF